MLNKKSNKMFDVMAKEELEDMLFAIIYCHLPTPILYLYLFLD
jgi:hypothetical protein